MADLQSVRDRARAAIAAGDYQLAFHLIELTRRHFPMDLEAAMLSGQLRLAWGQWAEARDSFEAVLQVDPESVAARAGLALLAERDGDLDGAIEQLERAFDLDSSNAGVAVGIGRLRSRLPRGSSVELGLPRHALARRSLLKRRYEKAILLFRDALRAAPDRVEIAVGLARALWLARRHGEAEQVAVEVLASYPNCLKMLAVLAGASFDRGEVEAMFLLRRTAEYDPGNPVARRMFLEAGLPFPRVGDDPEIPNADLRRVASIIARGRASALGPEPGDPAEEDWEEEESEPFFLPEVQLDGEWVRVKREAAEDRDRRVEKEQDGTDAGNREA